MTVVKRRTFQRKSGEWLNRAAAGEAIVIRSAGRPAVLLKAAPAARPRRGRPDWAAHFLEVRRRPAVSNEEFLAATLRLRVWPELTPAEKGRVLR
ncbi:MAG: hypothetical protein ACKVYV_18760 [Limisphaerales bacterium]